MKNKPATESAQPTGSTSRKRLILMKGIALLLPFLLLFLVEAGLRIFHYGDDLRLFIEYPGNEAYYMLNPDASKRYFTTEEIATTGNREIFKKEKGKNTVRIFVLGESTTVGYPYFHNGSFHRWLQYRLGRTFPDTELEIINLSLTAVNSYTVYGFSKQLVNYEPDAVLIYTGHNEYYGALGVGSTENIGSNPRVVNGILALRQLRLVQMATQAYRYIARSLAGTATMAGGSRMELMAADQEIAYGSEAYRKGVEQFRFNIGHTLRILQQHGVPVLLSNLVSNERDLVPFVSFDPPQNDSVVFHESYSAGQHALREGHIDEAVAHFEQADRAFHGHAANTYNLGRVALLRGDSTRAHSLFTRAKDLDGLRFRAPGELDTVITELAAMYDNVQLVDAKAVFEQYSDNGIIGDRLILEHVHPNLMGYALLSEAFYRPLLETGILPARPGDTLSLQQLLEDMPITAIDSLAGRYKVANLKRSWPFNGALQVDTFQVASFEEKLAYDFANRKISWYEALNKAYDEYISTGALYKARNVVAGLTLEYPEEVQFYEKAAMLSGELKDYPKAVFYFEKAFNLAPSFDKARYLLVINLQLDKPEAAFPYLDYAIRHNTSNFDLSSLKAAMAKIMQLKSVLAKDPDNRDALLEIADIYAGMDNQEGAAKYRALAASVLSENR